MGCIKLELLNNEYRKSEIKESCNKKELTFNFSDKNAGRSLFSAKELDEESGNYYYEQRYYNPKYGTFESRDQLFEKYFWMSPYAYCANNPVKYIDPDGMKVRNAHGADIDAATIRVSNAQETFDAFSGNKKVDGYKAAKNELKAANRELKTAQQNYNTMQGVISDLQTYNLDLYNELDNLKDENGNTVDVYLRLNADLSAQGREGQAIENYNSRTGVSRFSHSSIGLFCFDCIVIELNPSVSDLGRVFSHEGGHEKYNVKNASTYYPWLKKEGLNTPTYGGHRSDDPSGQEADRQENIYVKNRRK
jgi:RHS repeat-associated protein